MYCVLLQYCTSMLPFFLCFLHLYFILIKFWDFLFPFTAISSCMCLSSYLLGQFMSTRSRGHPFVLATNFRFASTAVPRHLYSSLSYVRVPPLPRVIGTTTTAVVLFFMHHSGVQHTLTMVPHHYGRQRKGSFILHVLTIYGTFSTPPTAGILWQYPHRSGSLS